MKNASCGCCDHSRLADRSLVALAVLSARATCAVALAWHGSVAAAAAAAVAGCAEAGDGIAPVVVEVVEVPFVAVAWRRQLAAPANSTETRPVAVVGLNLTQRRMRIGFVELW